MERAEIRQLIDTEPDRVVDLIVDLVAVTKRLEERVSELEAKGRRSSRNSHLPPSSDGPGAAGSSARPSSGRPRGGQPGHPGHHRALVVAPDVVVEQRPGACRGCGAPLGDAETVGEPRRHQVWEIPPPRVVVTEHRLVACRCRRCGTTTRGGLPNGTPRGAFGANVEAIIVGASMSERTSRRRTEALCPEITGVTLSLGATDRVLERTARLLAPALAEIDTAIRSAAAVNVDETSWAEAGASRWIWAAATPSMMRIRISESRSQAACTALVGATPGIVTSDRWSGYNHLALERRQVCWAHLARDFRAVAEHHDPRIAACGARLEEHCRAVFRSWRHHKDDRDALRASLIPHQAALDDTLGDLALTGVNASSTFAINLIGLGPALWTFIDHDGVEPTNNLAERVLRPMVIHRKTSYGTQTERGTRTYETLQSIIQTLRLQRRNVYQWLRDAIDAANHDRPLPSIVPP